MDLAKAAAVFASRNDENSMCLRTGALGGSIGRTMEAAPIISGPSVAPPSLG